MEILIWVLISSIFLFIAYKYLDIAVTLFVCAVTLFSRDFVHLHFPGTPIYSTELFLILIALSIALKWLKSRPIQLPDFSLKYPFLLLYLIAAVALTRGLFIYSDKVFVLRQAALFYYSILYFILPLAYNDINKIKRFIYSYIICCAVIVIVWLSKAYFTDIGSFGNIYLAVGILIMTAVVEKNKLVRTGFLLISGLGAVYIVDDMVRAVWVAVIGTIALALALSFVGEKFKRVAMNFTFKVVPISVLFVLGYFALNSQNIAPFFSKIISINPFVGAKHNPAQGPYLVKENIPANPSKDDMKGFGSVAYPAQTSKGVIYNFREIMVKAQVGQPSVNTRWRLLCWKDIIIESFKKPLMGWGFGKKFIPESIVKLGWGGSWGEQGFQDPHNSYLSVFYRTGLIGLSIFVFIILYFIYKTIIFIMSSIDSTNVFMAIAFLLVFIFINAVSMFMVVLEGPFLGIFLWLSMGFVESLMNIEKKTSFKDQDVLITQIKQ